MSAATCAALSIVLVHGAFADGSSWSNVIAALQARGCRVAAVQNPLTSLADDVAATRAVIERQPGKVLLVGHSWGGVVVTEAGNLPQVQGLVYLSAMVPDSGGAGRFRGGLGMVREFRLLADEATLTVRSDKRRFPPFGLAGGAPGSRSWNIVNPGPGETVLPVLTMRPLRR